MGGWLRGASCFVLDVCELSARQTNRLGIRHRRWGPRLLYSDRSGWTVDAPWAGLPRAYRWAAAPGATAAAAPRAAAPEATAAAAPPRASWHRRQRVGRAAAAARARMRPTPTAARSGVRGGGGRPDGGGPVHWQCRRRTRRPQRAGASSQADTLASHRAGTGTAAAGREFRQERPQQRAWWTSAGRGHCCSWSWALAAVRRGGGGGAAGSPPLCTTATGQQRRAAVAVGPFPRGYRGVGRSWGRPAGVGHRGGPGILQGASHASPKCAPPSASRGGGQAAVVLRPGGNPAPRRSARPARWCQPRVTGCRRGISSVATG